MNASVLISAISILLGCAAPSSGQLAFPPADEPALRRLDIAGLAGWFGEHRDDTKASYYEDWDNRWYGTAVAGCYWTPHAKTELEVGITSEGDSWATLFDTARDPNGYPVPTIERRARRDLTIAATQQWQFFENAWVHPFVAAGVSIDRTRTRRERQASYRGPDDDVRPPGPLPTESQVRAHALFGTGLKAYVNERTFFRTDFHVAVGDHDVVHLRLRAGLGVDF